LSEWYIEKDGEIVQKPMLEAAKWMETADRIVKREMVGKYRVSTVFLGLDHRFGRGGPPIVYETMVFEGGDFSDLDSNRYCTKEEAISGHKEMVKKWEKK